jgi:uncharacterized protein
MLTNGGPDAPQGELVGRVIGTDDATPLEFWVAIQPGAHLQLDDVVASTRVLPDGREMTTYGIVAQVRARHEGARFDSDVFLIADGVLPAEVSEAAQVVVTRVEPEVFVPPLPGQPVARAEGEALKAALFYDGMQTRLPAGRSRDGETVYINLDFIDGSRGAHINISGISGVATKTTYATFLLYSMFNSGVLQGEAINTRAIIFNVKGEDLLFLDRPNTRRDVETDATYRALGLEPGPFASVSILAPPRPGDPTATPNVSSRTDQVVRPFFFTLYEFCRQRYLQFLFADAEDDRQQYTIVVQNVTHRLETEAEETGDGGVVIDGQTCRTFMELVRCVEERVLDEDGDAQRWTGRAIGGGTVNAFIRRLYAAVDHVEALIRGDVAGGAGFSPDLQAAQVTVVDLHTLHQRAQRFVVGVILRRAFAAKEKSGSARPLQFIVLDELNKYAPREGSSPIKEILLDVAERGRSLGFILIGAQQTASEVERRVVGNCAIRVVGRLDAAEARRNEYGWLPQQQRQRATILKPGSMLVSQPELPIPLNLEFPFPAWATRPDEAGPADDGATQAEDPFDGL